MATYEVLTSVTGLKVGDTITDEQLAKNHPGLNVKKLLDNKAIRVGSGAPSAPEVSGVERVIPPKPARP